MTCRDPILFSVNIRSLLSNHDSVDSMLNSFGNIQIHFICLQELWQIVDPGPVQIPGFNLVFKQRGLLLLLYIIIANYYRPNHHDIYSLADQLDLFSTPMHSFWINYLILSKMSLLPQILT